MFHDLRYGARMLLKRPGFTCVAALTLGIGLLKKSVFTLIAVVESCSARHKKTGGRNIGHPEF